MRSGLYAHLVRLSFGFYDRHQTGQLMSRATVDLQGVRFFLGYGLIFFFQNVLTVVSVTVVLFFFEWRLALIVLAVTPLLVAARVPLQPRRAPDAARRPAEARRRRDGRRGEHRRRPRREGVRAGAGRAGEVHCGAREAVFEQTLRANRQRATYVPLISFVPLLAQAAVLLAGARMVAHGSLTPGGFVAFNLYLGMLVMPLRALGMWIGQAQRATAAGRAHLRGHRRAGGDRRRARTRRRCRRATGAIRFEHVSFEYLPGRPVLRDVDLDDRAGHDDRADRAHRLGQDDAHLARAALLRRHRRPRHDRRRRRPRRDAPLAAPRDRRHLAGSRSSSRPRCATTSRSARGDLSHEEVEARGAGCAGARVHRAAAEGLRHRDRRARDHALGRPAAAHRDRPRARGRPAHPHPRRRDGVGRRDDRGAASAPGCARRCATGRR